MSGELREVLNYPNWMWIIGVLLLALVLVWVGVWLIRWLRSNRLQEQNQIALIPLDEKLVSATWASLTRSRVA